MTRDLDNENKRIRNGNRFIYEPEDGSGVFARDVDRLFVEYANLRNKLYHKYKVNFNNEATRKELKSYIDEQFVKLVKEYDINNPVDFPGYVKKKLYARVSQAFVRGKQRVYGREILTSEENAIEETTEDINLNIHSDLEMQDLLSYIFKNVTLSDCEKDIVRGWLNYESDTSLKDQLSTKYNINPSDVASDIKQLKILVKNKIDEY